MALQKHLQIALEAVALVVCVGKNGQIAKWIKRILNTPQNRRAERIGNVEEHDSYALAAPAPQKTSHGVGSIAQALGSDFNPLASAWSDIARQRSIIENNRDCSRRKASSLSDVTHGNKPALWAGFFHGYPRVHMISR